MNGTATAAARAMVVRTAFVLVISNAFTAVRVVLVVKVLARATAVTADASLIGTADNVAHACQNEPRPPDFVWMSSA